MEDRAWPAARDGSVASPTLSAAVAWRHAARLMSGGCGTAGRLPRRFSTDLARVSRHGAPLAPARCRHRCRRRRLRGAGRGGDLSGPASRRQPRARRVHDRRRHLFVSAGLVASARRRERWTGALMIGAGFALFAGTLVQSNRSLPFTVGLAVSRDPGRAARASPPRLPGRPPPLALGAARRRRWPILNAIVVQVPMLMFMGIEQVNDCPCPHNLLFVRDDMAVHMRLMSIERYTGIAVAAAVVARSRPALAARFASAPARAASDPGQRRYRRSALVGATLLASALPYSALRSGSSRRSDWRSVWCRSPISSGCSGPAWAGSGSAT